MMNFKETSRERLEVESPNKITQAGEGCSLLVVTLANDEAYDLDIRVAATPPDQVNQLPPKFQSLVGSTIVYLKQGKACFVVRAGEDGHRIELRPPAIWDYIGGPQRVFDVKAFLRCEGNQVFVDCYYERSEMVWMVTVQGARYRGTYNNP